MSSTRTQGAPESVAPRTRTARTTRVTRASGTPRATRTDSSTQLRARTTSAPLDGAVTAPDIDLDGAPVDSGGAHAGRSRAGGPRPRAPRHRMLLASTSALAAGFIAVLLLNTMISQGAFRQHELEIKLILLAEKEEALAHTVQQAESPIEVERAARKLGMVPAAAPVFLRLSDGQVLGEAVPAPAPTGKVSFAGAPGIQPTPKPSPSPGDAAGESTIDPVTGLPVPSGPDSATGIDPALDPATGISPAPDPATDSDFANVEPSPAPGATTGTGAPTAGPTPAQTQEAVNP